MPNLVGKIERFLEDAVEGTSRRVFRSRLQPVELAKAASRALDQQRVVGPDGLEVPNDYRVMLHPSDYERFAPYRRSIETRITTYLQRYASDRGLRPVANWSVSLSADDCVKPRSVVVEAKMTDVAPGHQPSPATFPPDDGTLVFPVTTSDRARPALLRTEDGWEFAIVEEVTTIGRALDNDLVIPDSRVSRYHARIQHLNGEYLIKDLGSMNGTTIAGQRVAERRLDDGDEISLGGFMVVLRFTDG